MSNNIVKVIPLLDKYPLIVVTDVKFKSYGRYIIM